MIGINTKYKSIVACGRYLPNLMEFFQIALTFSFVVIGWVIFRAEDISQAYEFILRMFSTLFESRHIGFEKSAIYVAIIMFFVEWLQRDKQHALQFSNFTPLNLRPVRWFIYVLLAVLIVCFRGHSQTFIYFQF